MVEPSSTSLPLPSSSSQNEGTFDRLAKQLRRISDLRDDPRTKTTRQTALEVSVLFLDTAATVKEGLEEGTRTTHEVSLASAAVSGGLSLWGLIRCIKKTANAIFNIQSLKKEIKKKEEILSSLQAGPKKVKLQTEIAQLEKKCNKYRKKLPDSHKIFVRSVEVAAAVVIGIYRIGSLAEKLSETTSTALSSATTVLGAAIGSIGILIGGFEITRGIQKAIRAHKKLHEIEEKRGALLSTTSKTNIDANTWQLCKNIRAQQLAWEEINARRVYTSSILRVCNGALATVGGALAIAGAFTGGWTAIGIGLVAMSIGIVEIGVGVGSYIKGRQIKAQMKKEHVEREQIKELGRLIKESPVAQKQELAELLGVEDIEKFFISPTTILKHQYAKAVEPKKVKK